MGVAKVTDDMRQLMRTLFVKGLLPCEEIAGRLGLSKQSVALALKNMGVQTVKRKFIVECSECGTSVEKTRAEVRKSEHNFCSGSCFKEWMNRPDVKAEIQRNHFLSGKFAGSGGVPTSDGINMFFTEDDTLVFANREEMLEWKRTGLAYKAWSVMKGKNINVSYNEVKGKEKK